jgi:hypothetical protein
MPFIIRRSSSLRIICVYSCKPFVFTATGWLGRAPRRGLRGAVLPAHVPGGDTGLAAIDVRRSPSRPEPGCRLDQNPAGHLPNLRPHPVGRLLTLAIVVGEYTIASFLARNNVRRLPRCSARTRLEPAAVSLISFADLDRHDRRSHRPRDARPGPSSAPDEPGEDRLMSLRTTGVQKHPGRLP